MSKHRFRVRGKGKDHDASSQERLVDSCFSE